MKLLLNLLVLSSLSLSLSLSALILAGTIDQDNEILIRTLIPGSPLNIINDDPSKGPYVRFVGQVTSLVKKGENIVFDLYIQSQVEEYLKVPVKLIAETKSHLLIKTVDLDLKFWAKDYINNVQWTIYAKDYLDKLGFDNQIFITASGHVEGKDQAWSKQWVVKVN